MRSTILTLNTKSNFRDFPVVINGVLKLLLKTFKEKEIRSAIGIENSHKTLKRERNTMTYSYMQTILEILAQRIAKTEDLHFQFTMDKLGEGFNNGE